jgi:hypothetical protein
VEEPLSEHSKTDEPMAGQPHSFTYVRTDDELGAEHWHCLECGRQILLSWPPNYKRRVLVPGDEAVPHTAAKGGLDVSPLRASEGYGELLN